MSPPWQTKLRSTCDACAAAKVKCDKKHPACGRCRQNNFSCEYSPSRRHGKQSWASRVAQTQAQLHPRPTLSLLPVPNYTGLDLGDTMDLDSFDTFGLEDLVDLDVSVAAPTPTPLTSNTLTTTAPPVSESLASLPSFTSPVSPTAPTNAKATSTPPSATSPARFQPGIHDCQAKALTTLQSLHYCTMFHSELPGVLQKTDMSAPAQRPSSSMLPLDKILLFNRLATATVRGLLTCACAQQPHVVFLYMAILSRSLEWYRFALSPEHHFNCPNVEVPIPSNSDSASSSTARASSSTARASGMTSVSSDAVPERGVKATTVQIGDFHLEGEDRRALMRSVLTREVKKLGAVLDDLQAVHERSTQDDQAEDGSTFSWSHFGVSQMQSEVRNTLKRINDSGGTGWP